MSGGRPMDAEERKSKGDNSRRSRRSFLKAASFGSTLLIVPREVLGGRGFVAPSDKITVGYVGCGTQGIRQLMEALRKPELKIVAVCDPNRRSDDYVEWYKNELRTKIRQFLNSSSWGEDAKGCRCGREVGKELVEYAYSKGSLKYRCPAFSDFRAMLEQIEDLDAVYIMTPDHLHATIAVRSMEKGKHVITHKPIANYFNELVRAVGTAERTGKATHLFCAASLGTTPVLREWIRSGVIGAVREVHNWSTRPFWPQGMTEYPKESLPVPEGLQWSLWLGPVPDRPYHPAYTHAVFRGWYDFGTGALGDMGHYSFKQIFTIFDLGSPVTVEASRSEYWKIVGSTWKKQENRVSYPRASIIRWEFPARGSFPPLKLTWYDGGLRPPLPKELEEDGEDLPPEGMLIVGDEGKILADFMGTNFKLIPKRKQKRSKRPVEKFPELPSELDQWISACRGGKSSNASFKQAYPFSETILLGTIALRVRKKLVWSSDQKRFTNSQEANALLKRPAYRPGWVL